MATNGGQAGSGRVWRQVAASPRAALDHALSPADLQTLLLDVSRHGHRVPEGCGDTKSLSGSVI